MADNMYGPTRDAYRDFAKAAREAAASLLSVADDLQASKEGEHGYLASTVAEAADGLLHAAAALRGAEARFGDMYSWEVERAELVVDMCREAGYGLAPSQEIEDAYTVLVDALGASTTASS